MRKSIFVQFFFVLLLTAQSLEARIETKNIRKIFAYLASASESSLRSIQEQYQVDTDTYKILGLDCCCCTSSNTTEATRVLEELIMLYEVIDYLDRNNNPIADNTEERLTFIQSLSPEEIIRIYKVRNMYNIFADILDFAHGPSLYIEELNGIYQGRSSIALEIQRSFQKVFYTLENGDKNYAVGYNISNLPMIIGGNGCFRVYQDQYPIYHHNRPARWANIQRGTLSLSYEQDDIRPIEDMQYNRFHPAMTNYDEIYSHGKKTSTAGFLIYRNLKDQMFRINDSFIVSHAFRYPSSIIPGTHFIMTKQCEMTNPADCPIDIY